MSQGAQIDYDALAKQYGATSSQPAASGGNVDYDALAKQFGATSSQPAQSKSAFDSVKDFAGELWNKVNPVSALYGARDLAAHPINSLKADSEARQAVYQKAEDAFKKGDYAGGSAHLLYSFIPMLGPQLSQAGGDFQQGNYAKGAGASVGLGLSMVAPEVLPSAIGKLAPKAAMEALSKRMYQSALKPPPGSYSTAEVSNMVNTGLDNKIPVSEAGASRLNQLVSDLNDKVKAQIAGGAKSGATIDPYDVSVRADQIKAKFANQVNPEADAAAIDSSKQEFLRQNSIPPASGIGPSQPNPIPVDEAQALKQGTYRQLKANAYNGMSNATVEAQKALARGIKEELETQFPEIKGLNAREGQMINLDGALERAIRRTNNRDILSIGGKLASLAGTAAGSSEGFAGAGVGGVGALVLHHALTDPLVQSKLAIALRSASNGSMTLDASKLRVVGYVNALGNAAQGQQPQPAVSQQPAFAQ